MFIKFCGFKRLEDVQAAVKLNIQAIGFNFSPTSPRCIDPLDATVLVKAVPPHIETWGLFVNQDFATIESILKKTPLDVLQFHGDETLEFCRSFKKSFVKVFRPQSLSDLAPIPTWLTYTHEKRFLVDAFVAHQPGGTGRQVPAEILKSAVQIENGKIMIAGGLNPGNVGAIAKKKNVFGVDVSSGIEDDPRANPGLKSLDKMTAFVRNLNLREASDCAKQGY